MDGAHDMGGVGGFGPVMPEPNEPVFHAAWERRAFALTLAMAKPGGWTIDMSRFARENRPAAEYLGMSYYEIWIAGLERLMLERGLVSSDEIVSSTTRHIAPPAPVLKANDVEPMLRAGAPTERPASAPARFTVGDRVRTILVSPPTHTRLPKYIRGHVGIVERIHGCHVFADTSAHGLGEQPDWLYTVAFDGVELWDGDADPKSRTSVDAWERYLEPA